MGLSIVRVKVEAIGFDPALFSVHSIGMNDAPLRIVCSWCGSDQVSRDAWADWDVARQEWVLGAVFDAGFCHRCECDSKLAKVSLVEAET